MTLLRNKSYSKRRLARKLLRRTLVASGPKRHFAAAQQTVAFGGKATLPTC